jgi:hypothetical protein
MKWIPEELHWRNLLHSANALGRGSYAIIAVLLGLLIWAAVIGGIGWSSAAGTDVPLTGYVAMALGVVFSLVVGIGLMALVFYSSRSGYDEPAKLIGTDKDQAGE